MRLALDPGAAFVGDAAKVLIPADEPRMVLAVPRDALVLREEDTYLFKLDRENKAERIAVEVGAADGNMVEVTGMLKEGERVIIRRRGTAGERAEGTADWAMKENRRRAILSLPDLKPPRARPCALPSGDRAR